MTLGSRGRSDSSAAIKSQPIGYAGGYTDRTTGLINYQNRWYDPTTAAWTQADPAGTPDGPNRYTYVDGDPVNRIDDNGLWHKKAWKKVRKAARKAWKNKKQIVAVGAISALAYGYAGTLCLGTGGTGCGAAYIAATGVVGLTVSKFRTGTKRGAVGTAKCSMMKVWRFGKFFQQ